jgi:hypothetical protein
MLNESIYYMQEFEDDEVDQPPSDELNDYLQFCLTRNLLAVPVVANSSATVVSQPAVLPFDILKWWCEHHNKFP